MANTANSNSAVSPISDGHELHTLQAQGSGPINPRINQTSSTSPGGAQRNPASSSGPQQNPSHSSQTPQSQPALTTSSQIRSGGGTTHPPSTPNAAAQTVTNAPVTAIQPSPPSKPRGPIWKHIKQLWYQGWVAEICSIILAVLSLMAIAMILYSQQNTLQSHWPLKITINAAISVFVVLLKAGIALPISEGISQLKWQWFHEKPRTLIDMEDFDSASRDSWSSLLFLFKSPSSQASISWRRPITRLSSMLRWNRGNLRRHFAKFAAFLAVLAFITDPFTQQIVEYESCTRSNPGSQATISRTNAYIATGGFFNEHDFVIDGAMSVSINRAMVDPPKDPTGLIVSSCPSGECTFGSFSTVGMCHSCQELTARIENVTKTESNGLVQTNFTLSDPSFWNGSLSLGGPVGILGGQGYRLLHTNLITTRETGLPISLTILMSTSLSDSGPIVPSPIAFNCSMAPCVKSYNASMSAGKLTQTLFSTQPIGLNQLTLKPLTSHPSDDAYLLATNTVWRNGRLEACAAGEANRTGSMRVATSNIGASPNNPPNFDGDYSKIDTNWLPKDCVWTFGFHAHAVISKELARTLDRLEMVQTKTHPLEFPFRQPSVASGPVAAQNIWRNGTANLATMNDFMAGLTDSITATIRQRGKDGASEWTKGIEAIETTCVNVRWAWFSYPAVLVGLAIVFLIMAVAQSSHTVTRRAWKSSNLAMLFCELDQAVHAKLGINQTRVDMKDLAESVKVQLVSDSAGRAKFV